MSLYLIAGVNKHDPKTYDEYVRRAMPSLEEHHVEALAISDAPQPVEGSSPYGRYVLLKFRDRAHFETWYHSPAYQAALPLRLAAAETPFIVTVEGLD